MIALDMPIKFFIFLIIFLFHAASTYSEENSQLIEIENPRFTEIRVKELDDEMERDLGKYVVDTTALMQDLRKLETIERVS